MSAVVEDILGGFPLGSNMPAVLGTLRRQLIKVTEDATKVYETHVIQQFHGPCPTGYAELGYLLTSNIIPIPVVTYESLLLLQNSVHARSSEIAEGLYGLCIFILPQTPGMPGPDEWVHTSSICLCPRFVEQLAAGQNPKLVDTMLLAHLRKLGRTYPMPPEPTQARSDLSHVTGTDDRLECCICMAADAVYKWSNCSHSGSPLACLRCRNLVNSLAGPMDLKKMVKKILVKKRKK